MKILLSGISSPLGLFTAKLLLQKGYTIRGFSRSIPKKKIPGIEFISCDLRSSSKLKKLVKGCDAIIHIAALSSPWGKRKDFFEINAEGTRILLTAALEENCKRFIYISTPSIYFEYKDALNICEHKCAKRPVNDYTESKLQAEKYIELAKHKGLETFILRPKALFGPGDNVLVPRILKVLKKGGVPRFFNHDILIDVTYVENVAYAIALAIDADKKYSGSRYNITNGEPLPLHTVIQMLLKEMGYVYKERKIPYTLAKIFAYLSEKMAIITRKEPAFTQYSVGALAFSQTLSIKKARKELGYRPIISIKEGTIRYGKWWHENHHI